MASTLGETIEADVKGAGYSIRGFAAELQKRRPRKSLESWRGTLRRYMRDLEQPGPEIAALISSVLGKPVDYYVRPQKRESLREENSRLKAENEGLRRALEAAKSDDAQSE